MLVSWSCIGGKKTACGTCGRWHRSFYDRKRRRVRDLSCGDRRVFAFYVGRRCRASTIEDVASELHLDWHTVRELEKHYMREQLRREGTPGPRVIGIDEISIKKRHSYRIVVSDLVRQRPIWFGGKDRSEASMDEFFKWLGPKRSVSSSAARTVSVTRSTCASRTSPACCRHCDPVLYSSL